MPFFQLYMTWTCIFLIYMLLQYFKLNNTEIITSLSLERVVFYVITINKVNREMWLTLSNKSFPDTANES